MTHNVENPLIARRYKIAQTHDTLSTAYHESGHTIYGLLHFMKIEVVYLVENKKLKRADGFTHFNSPELSTIKNPELLTYLISSEVGIRYAGLTAERYFFKTISGSDKFPMFLKDGSSDDTEAASTIISDFKCIPAGKARYAYKKKIISNTLTELQDQWQAVISVAHALFQKKRLYHSDLKNIIIENVENKKFWKQQFKKIDQIFLNCGTLDEKDFMNIIYK